MLRFLFELFLCRGEEVPPALEVVRRKSRDLRPVAVGVAVVEGGRFDACVVRRQNTGEGVFEDEAPFRRGAEGGQDFLVHFRRGLDGRHVFSGVDEGEDVVDGHGGDEVLIFMAVDLHVAPPGGGGDAQGEALLR